MFESTNWDTNRTEIGWFFVGMNFWGYSFWQSHIFFGSFGEEFSTTKHSINTGSNSAKEGFFFEHPCQSPKSGRTNPSKPGFLVFNQFLLGYSEANPMVHNHLSHENGNKLGITNFWANHLSRLVLAYIPFISIYRILMYTPSNIPLKCAFWTYIYYRVWPPENAEDFTRAPTPSLVPSVGFRMCRRRRVSFGKVERQKLSGLGGQNVTVFRWVFF